MAPSDVFSVIQEKILSCRNEGSKNHPYKGRKLRVSMIIKPTRNENNTKYHDYKYMPSNQAFSSEPKRVVFV